MNRSSDEDVSAPSPAAAVLARRASREVKPMREESGSDEDAEEREEWVCDDDDEAMESLASWHPNQTAAQGNAGR